MADMYTLEPIMGLFTNVIPIKQCHFFLTEFFKRGWKFFNAFFIEFMRELQSDLMNPEYSSYEIIQIFKTYYSKVRPERVERGNSEIEKGVVKMSEPEFDFTK